MKKVITVKQMRESDLKTIELGISGKDLMYRAAMGVYNSYSWYGKIGIFCGSGNNAGDGYALAEILYKNGFDVVIVLVSNKFSEDGKYYFDLCKGLNIPIMDFSMELTQFDIYVDALLGTGFKGEPRGNILECIKLLNALDKPIISIDINSGLNGDNGLSISSVKSDLTVSIGYLKPGLLLNHAKDLVGELENIDIGILCDDVKIYLLENNDIKEFLKPRDNFSNKGTYGYVGIMGGSSNYPGAVRLANLGQVALRSGCGVSRVIVPSDIYELIFHNVLETTVFGMPSKNGKMFFDEKSINLALKGLKVISVGVGWGESEEYIKILSYILNNYEMPVIIDADGLNTLSKMDLNILNNTKCKIILTPHLKEFSRLIKLSVKEIIEDSINIVSDFINKYNVTLLLKGPTTIVADKKVIYLIDTGNSGMATAGSGDVLTGIITGLLGYHYEDITKTVAVAAYINGYAGDLAKDEFGEIGMVSSDTAKFIAIAIKNIIR